MPRNGYGFFMLGKRTLFLIVAGFSLPAVAVYMAGIMESG